jgi:antitoxin HigA-1
MARRNSKKKDLEEVLRRSLAGRLTFGVAVASIRQCEEISQSAWAERLGISKSHLCDIEKGRKTISAERAASWARQLGYSESVFVQLALQDELDAAGLRYRVSVAAA